MQRLPLCTLLLYVAFPSAQGDTTTAYKLTFVARLSSSTFSDDIKLRYRKGVIAAVNAMDPNEVYTTLMDPAQDYIRVSTTQRVYSSVGDVEVVTAVSLDNALELDTADWRNFNSAILTPALALYEIVLAAMTSAGTACPVQFGGAVQIWEGSCGFTCPANRHIKDATGCACDTGYYVQNTDATPPCDSMPRGIDGCQSGAMTCTGTCAQEILGSRSLTLQIPQQTGNTEPFASVLVVFSGGPAIDDESLVLGYDGSAFTFDGYEGGINPIESSPGVYTGRDFVYTAATRTLTVGQYKLVTFSATLQEYILVVDWTLLSLPPTVFSCLACSELPTGAPLLSSESCTGVASSTPAPAGPNDCTWPQGNRRRR